MTDFAFEDDLKLAKKSQKQANFSLKTKKHEEASGLFKKSEEILQRWKDRRWEEVKEDLYVVKKSLGVINWE